MSVLSALCLFVLILVSAIPLVAAAFVATVVLAYRDPRAGYSYFASGVTAPRVKDDDNRNF